MSTMTPCRYIREVVFSCRTQKEFADLLGYEQATISRFESGTPFSSEAQRRIRAAAERRRLPWDNNWFFIVPRDGPRPLDRRRSREGVAA